MGDLYSVLGLRRDASQDQIKSAYRKLAAKLHPDKNPNDSGSEQRFKDVNRAHQVLGDPKKRRLYDEFGEDGLREGFDSDAARAYRRGTGAGRGFQGGMPGGFGGAEGFGFGDLFGDLFRGRAGGRPAGRHAGLKGSDVASEVSVDFVAAVRGAELKLQLQDGGEAVTVRVPPGAGDGDKVRVPGHGAPGSYGGEPGDLVLAIRVRPHPHFERQGLDLYLDLPVTIGEAYSGGKVRVPTPHGDVTLTVPPHAQSGQVVRLREKGVQRKAMLGDLYVRFMVKLPESDDKAIAKAVNVLERATEIDVRGGMHF